MTNLSTAFKPDIRYDKLNRPKSSCERCMFMKLSSPIGGNGWENIVAKLYVKAKPFNKMKNC